MTVVATPVTEIVRAADGTPLKAKLQQAERAQRMKAYGLILPLLAFTAFIFIVPIGTILTKSVTNPEILRHLPRTVEALRTWDGKDLPGEETFAALAADLGDGYRAKTISISAIRLNYEIPGYRTVLLRTARSVSDKTLGPYKQALIDVDGNWGTLAYWAAIKRNAAPLTAHYYLTALDLERSAEDEIVAVTADRSIFVAVYARTFWISLFVTMACLILGYPVAYLLATLRPQISNLLMILVLFPFWTSSLVRTVAWIVLLQQNGPVNDALVGLGLVREPIHLIFNRPGMLIAMIHVMLPFMILPLYSVMKGIDAHQMRAAKSLGANPVRAFFTVYLPLSLPGVGAGSLLVFIVSISFYITPELIGGGGDRMISQFIASYANEILNWGQAAALAVLLLLAVVVLYAFFSRLPGAGRF